MPDTPSHPAVSQLTLEVLARADYCSALGKKAVANNFYNLLPLIADVRKAWPNAAKTTEEST